jgi:hypothetical protein
VEIGRHADRPGQLGPTDGKRTRREARPRQKPAASQFGHAERLDQLARIRIGRLKPSLEPLLPIAGGLPSPVRRVPVVARRRMPHPSGELSIDLHC